MTMPEGIAFGSLVLGLMGFVWKVSNDESGKRKRIFERIDEEKKKNEEKFQSTKVCDILHKEIKEDMGEIKHKVDCIPDIKAGMDLLLKKNGL